MGRLLVIASIAAELRLGGVLPTITYGVAYSATLHQVGGTGIASLACASALPTGFTATDNGDGTITFSGTTTDPGDFPITVTGLDADRTPLIANYVLHVQVLPISLSGDAGDQRLGDSDTFSGYGATGGSGTGFVWAVVGSLPPGWGPINSTNGHIPRTPTTVGNYNWGIQVTDSLGNVSAVYADSATIRYPVITLTGSFASLGIIGVAYSSDITITGGDGIYSNPRFTSGAVSGMALSIVTVIGVKKLRLSGTPTTQETDSITVAVDAHEFDASTVTATHSQSVTEDPALTLTGTFTASATVGAAYQSDLLLGGGDGTYSLHGGTGLSSGSLPAGLALSIVTVSSLKYLRLSGTPTTAGTPAFTVSIDSGDGQNVTGAQTVTVVYPAVVLTGTFATPLYDGVPYSQSIAISGGIGAYSSPAVASGALPSGLSLSVSGSNLVLSGTCNSGAMSTFTVSVQDSNGHSGTSASQSLTRQDQYFANVKSRVSFNGANNSTSITDVTGKVWTRVGTPVISTAQSKFGGSSLDNSSATGNAFSTPNSADFDFGSGDFTIEVWLRQTSVGTGQTRAFGGMGDTSLANGWRLNISSASNRIGFGINLGGVSYGIADTSAPTINSWIFIAAVRDGGTIRLYRDGVQVASTAVSGSMAATTEKCLIGNQSSGGAINPNAAFNGFEDDWRITKGVCRRPSGTTFTPPAHEFPNS